MFFFKNGGKGGEDVLPNTSFLLVRQVMHPSTAPQRIPVFSGWRVPKAYLPDPVDQQWFQAMILSPILFW